ncbi:unnamed protein product [Rotaria sp. Silwood1]|nr:unnamed protein product [Rotaria sp. Silwood1]
MEAENAPTIPSSKLRNDLATRMNLTDTQMAALPKATAIERALYRARSKTLPSVPKDLSFDIPPEFKTTANAFPLCWALLNDKRSKSYKLVFDKLIAAAHNLNMKFCPRIIISDFESGLIKTMKVLKGLIVFVNMECSDTLMLNYFVSKQQLYIHKWAREN